MALWMCFFLLIVCVGIYFLYSRGMAVSKSIGAILFIFHLGKSADQVTLDSCTGWVRHVGRFPKSQAYEFTFDGRLSSGEVNVILLDRNEQQLLKLNGQFTTGKVELDGKSRYYLRWEFKNATGKCGLYWQKQ